MSRIRGKRFILISGVCGFFISLLLSQALTRITIRREAQFQVEALNRQLEIFNSSLTQLAAFLSEPGDLNDDHHIEQRLNRFVYGDRAIYGIELKTKNALNKNTQTSSGQFINGGIIIPPCISATEGLKGSPQTLSACEDGRLSIARRFEDFDGNPFILKLILNPSDLPGGKNIHLMTGQPSATLACTMSTGNTSPCSVRTPAEFSHEFLVEFYPKFIASLVYFALFILILFRLVVIPVGVINKMLIQASRTPGNEDTDLSHLGILKLFREPVKAVTELLRTKADLEMKNAAAQARARISDEVAHNIRSPLAVLQAVETDIASAPEDTRIAFRSAVNRIGDIINLLDSPKSSKLPSKKQKHLISSLIEVFLSEMRRQYAGRKELDFSIENEGDTYGVFASVDNTSFKTILSNLVNNAAEAMPVDRDGKISIKLRSGDQSFCEILIIDNGLGMSPETLAKATTEGFTHGKASGKGLGLFHAKSVIETWGGNLTVSSKQGHGTTIVIRLPKENAPDWFLPSLKITPGSTVGVLDDDPSVHHLWKNRIGSMTKLVHFQSGREFIGAIESGAQFSKVLVDYELIGEDESGLDLIEALKLQDIAVLVTSRFEDESVRSGCERLKVHLLPKMLAAQVPLSGSEALKSDTSTRVDAILLDDDPMCHLVWKLSGKDSGKRVDYFLNIDEFFSQIENYPKNTPIFVDFIFEGQELNGIQVCERLREMGFSKLSLASGMKFDDLPSWLPSVGKGFPFRQKGGNKELILT